MEKPKFSNRPNPHVMYRYSDGQGVKINQDYWISRAPAVVGIVFAFGIEDGGRVLVIKRSKNMREEANKYGAPSGYLDWDESGYEGMVREVYEETSLYLPNYSDYVVFDNNKQPFFVNDDPKKDKNQNVSLVYILVLDFKNNPDVFPVDIENYTDHETAQVWWLKLSYFYNVEMEWAFNHDERIKMALNYFNGKQV